MKNIFQSVEDLKKALPVGKRVTLVGGCFDLLHVGHIHMLKYAASLEDILVVAVLSDDYVKKYKNPLRPIIKQAQRAAMVASVKLVDFVYISAVSTSSVDTLKLLKPDSVVFEKGSNTEKMQQRIKNIANHSPNTKIKFLPRYLKSEVSTSNIINKIRKVKI